VRYRCWGENTDGETFIVANFFIVAVIVIAWAVWTKPRGRQLLRRGPTAQSAAMGRGFGGAGIRRRDLRVRDPKLTAKNQKVMGSFSFAGMAPKRTAFSPHRPTSRGHSSAFMLAGIYFIVFLLLFWVFAPTFGGSQGPAGPRGAPGASGGGGGGGAGADGYTALVMTSPEGVGPNCANAGQKIDSGLDNGDGAGTARDGILQSGEIDYVAYTCNGTDGVIGSNGYNSLIKTTTESPGGNCANGGKKVESGLDNGDGGGTANNGILEAGEIDATTYVCNGADGSPGAPGAQGFASLVKTTAESPGVNCGAGGQKIETGIDNGDGGGTSGNFILEAGEVDATTYVCNGAAGSAGTNGFNSLIKLTTESPGGNCADGGKKVDSGLDNGDGGGTANNGILEAGEVDVTTYVCDGADGTNGYNALVTSSAESPGANCVDGGRKIQAGADNGDGGGTAGNNILEAGEIDTTGYACNGANGFNTIFKFTAESAGANCANSGQKVESGLDNGDGGGTARDGTLQAGEVDNTVYVCNGAAGSGFTGVAGLGSAFTSTSTTGAEVTGLTIALSSTGTYVFTYYLICQTAATGTGIDFGVNFDSTQDVILANMQYPDSGTTATTGIADGVQTGDGSELLYGRSSTISESTTSPDLNVITGVTTADQNFLVYITGVVKITAAGNMEVWSATDVASSQVTIGIGSSVTIVKTA